MSGIRASCTYAGSRLALARQCCAELHLLVDAWTVRNTELAITSLPLPSCFVKQTSPAERAREA